MKKQILVAVLAVAAVFQTACAGTNKTLRPSELNSELRDMDGDKVNPFAQERTKIEYVQVGLPEYDKFFQTSAQVQGTIVMADLLVQQMASQVKQTKAALMPQGDVASTAADASLNLALNHQALNANQKAALQKTLDHAKLTVAMLEELPKKSLELVNTGKGLVANAPKQFTGIQAVLKLPTVTAGLNDSIKRLQSAADRTPKLVDSLQDQTQQVLALVSTEGGPVEAQTAPAPAPTRSKKSKKSASASPKKKTRG